MNANDLIIKVYIKKARALSGKEKRGLAEFLGINYYTLMNKLNGYGRFVKDQPEKLTAFFNDAQETN